MGAWIEIPESKKYVQYSSPVAPLVGAWIEIMETSRNSMRMFMSLPLWERGLKFNKYTCWDIYTFVAPLVGAWIEIICVIRI